MAGNESIVSVSIIYSKDYGAVISLNEKDYSSYQGDSCLEMTLGEIKNYLKLIDNWFYV